MTKTEMMEQTLADMGVRVFSCPVLHRKAIASSDGFVGMGQTQDSCEAHTILAHEMLHFKLRAFYPPEDTANRRRSEAQVHRALMLDLCPKEALCTLLQRGLCVQEIAEELEVTTQLICEAFAFYQAQDPAFCQGEQEPPCTDGAPNAAPDERAQSNE
ncbi:MAG: hypothetical protein R3Y06_01500 [Faecalibacterium sp.]